MSRIQVAVRVRPRNPREAGQEVVVSITGPTVEVAAEGTRHHKRHFTFDHAFWSTNPADAHFVSQEKVRSACCSL